MKIIDVTSDNLDEFGLFCIKNKKEKGYQEKSIWLHKRFSEGLKLKIATDDNGNNIGFIEYIPAELAWRPVEADNFLFIHCIMVYKKSERNREIGSQLLNECEKEAKNDKKAGICTFTSSGPWIASDSLFIKNGYSVTDSKERFELITKKLIENSKDPQFIDWTESRSKLKGWHLIYSHQCPWHHKSIEVIIKLAEKYKIALRVNELKSSEDAKNAPTG